MKTKIISFIFLIAFITTAFDCNPDPIGYRCHHTSPLFQELQGRYQSRDGYTRLTLNNNTYTLSLGGTETAGGVYRINDLSYVELDLMDGYLAFERQRDSNGQIVGLREALGIDRVLYRMGQDGNFILYDNLDMVVIRQNLGGIYRGTINGQHMILELDNVQSRYSMERNGQDYSGDYIIERSTDSILLVLHVESRSERYYLHSIENSIERITSIHVGIEEGLYRDVPPIEAPPTNSNDSDDSNSEIPYGTYSSQNRSFGYHDVPTSFDYCRERLATLFGRYEDNGTRSISMIEITPTVMYITINNERIIVNYTIEFRSGNGKDHSTIRFEIGEQTYRLGLVIRLDNNTIIGLINNTIYLGKTQHYEAIISNMGNNILHITGGTN